MGGIFSFWWATSSRYDGRHHLVLVGGFARNQQLKKRIVRTLIHEAVADIDDGAAEIVLTLHWVGAPTLSTACRVGGVDNGPAPPPTSSRPFARWR